MSVVQITNKFDEVGISTVQSGDGSIAGFNNFDAVRVAGHCCYAPPGICSGAPFHAAV